MAVARAAVSPNDFRNTVRVAAYTNANGLAKKSFTDIVNLVDLCNGNVGRGSQISFPLTVIGQKL